MIVPEIASSIGRTGSAPCCSTYAIQERRPSSAKEPAIAVATQIVRRVPVAARAIITDAATTPTVCTATRMSAISAARGLHGYANSRKRRVSAHIPSVGAAREVGSRRGYGRVIHL